MRSPAALKRFTWRALGALALSVPLLFVVYDHRLHSGLDDLERNAAQRLALASASLNAELQRFESLPAVLAQHPALGQLLAAPRDRQRVAEVNALLAKTSGRTGAALLYLVDPAGLTLAASNWTQPDSLVGQNYAFRPYFREALAGRTGMFFGVGATTGIPGFFIAHPVSDNGHVIGVVAVKIDLSALEATWAESGEAIMVVDRHGVVALSSNAAWKFATLAPLSEDSRGALEATRQYFTAPLAPLPLVRRDARRASLNGREFVVQDKPLRWIDWRLLMFADTAPTRAAARSVALAAGLGLCVVVVGALYWVQRSRRIRERLAAQAVLERTVAERTADLAQTNAHLLREIDDRVAAEQKLRGAQRALIEANRLGALGQMAAGIVHELNQPLSAMRGFAGNGLTLIERGQPAPVKDNLQQIIGLVERMARLTTQLKVFASRQNTSQQRAAAGAACAPETIGTVAGWFARRLEKEGVTLRVEAEPIELPLEAQALEQVVSNLVGNALDALAGRPGAEILVRAGRRGDQCILEVADNGPGIPQAQREQVLQPFYSTKPLGHGLGLGLPIVADLVQASGGQLTIGTAATGGLLVSAAWALADEQHQGAGQTRGEHA